MPTQRIGNGIVNSDHELSVSRSAVCEAIIRQGWVKQIHWYQQTDSTNLRAKEWAGQAGDDHPSLFIADVQTQGRGRSQKPWWSPDGCLMFSIVVGPSCIPDDPKRWGQLALLAGLAVARTVESFLPPGIDVQLKWPNDVYLNGKKCSGILIENCNQSTWAIGIGCNVQNEIAHAPDAMEQTATSLHEYAERHMTGERLAPEDVLPDLLHNLHEELMAWRQDGNANWLARWRERCLLSARAIRVRLGDSSDSLLSGRCLGIDDEGRLLLQTDDRLVVVNAGEIVSWH